MKVKRKMRLVLGILLTVLMLMPGGMIKADEAEVPPPAEETIVVPEAEVVEPAPVAEELPPAEIPEEPEKIPDEVPAVEEQAAEPEVEIIEEPLTEDPAEPPLENLQSAPASVPDVSEVEVEDYDGLTGDYYWGKEIIAEGYDFDAKLGWDKIETENAVRGGSHLIRFGTIEIRKIWYADKEMIPDCVAFELYANGKRVGVLPILASKQWKTKIVVPVMLFGEVISYTIKEIPIHGFDSKVEGMTITNQQMRYLSIKKVWMGDEKPEKMYDFRPESVTYRLKANGEFLGGERTLTEADGWKDFIKVPAYDAGGKIRYEVVENPLEGYSTKYVLCEYEKTYNTMNHDHDEKCADIIIMNIFTNKKDITLIKLWDDNNSEGRPKKVSFELYQNNKMAKTVNLREDSGWKAVETVHIYDKHWKPFVYKVGEKHVPEGYRAIVDGLTITNKLIEMIEVKGEKFWWDNGEGRPKFVKVSLYANDDYLKTIMVREKDGKWLYNFGKYPKYDKHDKLIVYTVKEAPVWGYKSHVEGYNIFNQKWEFIPVRKIWKGDDKINDVRPDMVKYQLLADGETYGPERMLSEDKEWKDKIWVPAYDAEGKIEYTIKEMMVEGYETTYKYCTENDEATIRHSHDDKCEFLIINTFKNEKEITLKKVWDDANYEGRPVEVTFNLYQNDEMLQEVLITKENEWMKKVSVAIYDEDGKAFEYEISEKVVPEGYEDSVDGLTITNKRIAVTPEMIEIKGEKTWLDDGTGRPEFINVKLMADGMLLTMLKVMPVEGKWTYDFGKLPKYDDEMKEIVYTVSEEAVVGYECIPGEYFDIVNRRTGMITISGEKTWDDLMNRPASITVYLERNGESFEEVEVKANEMGKWLYSFKETAQFDEKGMPYTFTVSEKYILGYEAKVTGFNILNVQQRATMKVLKVNEADKPLAGAIFEVRDLSGKVLKTFTTGADGLFSMELPLGMYRLVEISPPPGYAKNSVPRLVILFKAGDVQTIEVVNSLDKPAIVPTPIPNYPVLPRTGAGTEMGFYLFGFASVALGLLTMKKKKN